jgi:hypothetical protein
MFQLPSNVISSEWNGMIRLKNNEGGSDLCLFTTQLRREKKKMSEIP